MTRRHYLDHASTSPLRPEARDAMVAALDLVGDPGRIHEEGLTVRVAVEQAREQVAATFGARPREVVFTGSGTEAIATAVAGVALPWWPPGAHRRGALGGPPGRRTNRDGDRGRRRRPGPRRSRRGGRRRPPRHRGGPRAGGQPRGRHPPTGGRGGRRLRGPRRAGPRRRRPGQRPRPGGLRRRRAPTCCPSAPTSSEGRPAWALCWYAAASAWSRSSSAATRSGPDGPAWRTWPGWRASPPPARRWATGDWPTRPTGPGVSPNAS